MINLLKTLYYKNKFLFLLVIIGLSIFVAGCSSSGAPSGPIGGGC